MEYATLKSTLKKVEDGTYEFVMSEETVDRDGEIIEIDGWELKEYKDNSILLFGHRHDIPGIGKVGRVVKEINDGKKQLVAKKVRFASPGIYELADVVHGLVDDEIVKATSVGFQPLERIYPTEEDNKKEKVKPVRVRTKRSSLYELSIVNVGAHPAALRIKSAIDKATLEYRGKDIDSVQARFFADQKEIDYEIINEEEISEKPYPNEHACRLVEPVDGAPTRRKNGEQEHEGKKYDVIYQKQDDKWVQQAYRYPKKTWSASQARSHCKAHEGKFEAASESSIESLMERLVEKIDRLCESIEKMAKPKQKRIYDAIFAGDQDEVHTKLADKEESTNPFAEDEPPKPLFKE